MDNNWSRPLKQPKIDLDTETMNPILKKLIETMNKEGFMIEEQDILKRLEEYKRKKKLS